MIRLAALAVAALALSLSACDEKDNDEGPVDGAVATGDAGASAAASKPGKGKGKVTWADLLGLKQGAPGTAQTMAAAAKTFESYDKCIGRVSLRLPPELGAEMLPRDDLPDAICRIREALARQDSSLCRLIKSYRQRKSCATIYAIHHGQPEACRASYAKRRGRDGYCLALAQRDATLCRATAKEAEEASCLAVLGGDASACSRLRERQQGACRASAKRWAHLKAKSDPALPAGYQPSMELTLLRGNGRKDAVSFDCVNYGVVASPGGKVNFCEYLAYGYRSRAYRGPAYRGQRQGGAYAGGLGAYRRAKLKLAFSLPAEGKGTVKLGASDVAGVKLGYRDEYTEAPSGEITIERFEPRRGGRVVGTIALNLGRGSERIALKGRFDTFVRDVVDARDMRFDRRHGLGRYGIGGRGGGAGLFGRGGGRWGRQPERDPGDPKRNAPYGGLNPRGIGGSGGQGGGKPGAGLQRGLKPLEQTGDKQTGEPPKKRVREKTPARR